jgi:RNA polymerase sigma-70 factor (ECF subfamily)
VTALAEGTRTLTDARAIERSFTDPEAFVIVFERHFPLVHRYLQARAGGSAADDLAAETFEIAFRRRGDYDISYVDARPWLFGIALNLAREARRREERLQRALLRLAPREGELDVQIEHAEANAGAGPMSKALKAVSEEDRDLLLLFACVGLSYEECAAALSLPVGTVRSRLHRLRMRLRRELEPEGAPELEDHR